MSLRSLDAVTTISPLDALLAPPPVRDSAGDGTFAQHLAPPPPTKDRPRVEESAPRPESPPQSPSPPPSAPRAEQETATRAVDDLADEEASEEEQLEAQTQSDDQHHTPVAASVEAADQQKTPAEDEESPITEQPVDEVLLQAVAPVAFAVAEKSPKAVTEEASPEQPAAVAFEEELSTKPAPSKNGAIQPKGDATLSTVEPEATPAAKEQPVGKVELDTPLPAMKDALPVVVAEPSASVAAEQAVVEGTNDANIKSDSQEPLTATEDVIASEDVPAQDVSGSLEQPLESLDQSLTPLPVEREPSRDDKRRQPGDQAKKTSKEKQQAETLGADAKLTTPGQVETSAAAPTIASAAEAPPASDLQLPPPVAAAPVTNVTAPGVGAPAMQRLPPQLLARAATSGSRGSPANPADQVRFVARVAKAFQTAQSRGGELQLRLSPAELGSLKLEIKLKDGVLNARVEAENPTAKSLLVENLPVLKERLAEQGIVVEKFDVELMDRQSQGQSDPSGQRERRPTPRGHFALQPEQGAATSSATAEPRAPRGDSRLNVTV